MANYLYNGIELPALPEWDKTAYPYAVLWTDRSLTSGRLLGIYVWAFNHPVTFNPENGKLTTTLGAKYCANRKLGQMIDKEEPWEKYGEGVTENGGIATIGNGLGEESLVWSNHDIYTPNGVLYLAASDPVPVPDEPDAPDPEPPEPVLSWQKHDAYKPNTKWDGNTFYRVMGGKWVKQDEVKTSVVEDEPTGDPIAYLYNDVQLPDINRVWTDKVTYPYAMITRTITNGSYLLLVCGDMPYYTEQAYNAEEGYHPVVISPGPYKGFAYVAGSWVLSIENTDSGVSNNAGNLELIWTNVDVMNKDNGSVYFDASEPPVPVYA